MNSRKTNLKLIENITGYILDTEVPNMASISKNVLFCVFKILEKMVFQLIFEFIRWIGQLQICRKTVQNYCCHIWQMFFWPKHFFLKLCFNFKIEDLVFAWFWPDYPYMLKKYRGQISLKNLNALEQSYWLNLSGTRSKLILKSFNSM